MARRRYSAEYIETLNKGCVVWQNLKWSAAEMNENLVRRTSKRAGQNGT